MSCGSIDEFKNLLRNSFAGLKEVISSIDDAIVGIAAFAQDAVNLVTSALGSMAGMAGAAIGAIGSVINDFAASAMSAGKDLVNQMKMGIVGLHASAVLDKAKASFGDLIECGKSVSNFIGDGMRQIIGKISSILPDLSGLSLDSIMSKLLDLKNSIASAIGDVMSSIGNAISDLAGNIGNAISDAFCKGLAMAIPSIGAQAEVA